jgi:hypothetical protein
MLLSLPAFKLFMINNAALTITLTMTHQHVSKTTIDHVPVVWNIMILKCIIVYWRSDAVAKGNVPAIHPTCPLDRSFRFHFQISSSYFGLFPLLLIDPVPDKCAPMDRPFA